MQLTVLRTSQFQPQDNPADTNGAVKPEPPRDATDVIVQ